MNNKLKPFLSKLLGINDSTHRIALGVAIGFMLGVLPGTGALAAIAMAFVLRANKAAALAGALAVNTWITVVMFPFALFIGAFCLRLDIATVKADWIMLVSHFSWDLLFSAVVRKGLLAVAIGFVVIGGLLGAIGYALTYGVICRIRSRQTFEQSRRTAP